MYIDIFVAVLLVWATYSGWRDGFLRELVSTLGIVAGLIVAVLCYDKLSAFLTVDGSEVNMVTSIIAFALLWIVVPIALGFAATLLTKVINFTPASWINRALGSLVSIAKYALLLSCLFNAMQSLRILDEKRTEGSYTYKPVAELMSAAMRHVVRPTYNHVMDGAEIDTLWVDFTNGGK